MPFNGPSIDNTRTKSERIVATKHLELPPDLNSTDASAISVDTPITMLSSGGGETRTLANGLNGQVKKIVDKVHGGAVVVTPANLFNGTTITFNAIGDAWEGVFYAGEWHTTGTYGTAAVA